MVASTFLATAADGDRLALEPYRIAAQIAHGGGGATEAEAVAAEGRRRQQQLATDGLDAIVRALRRDRGEPVVAALLVNRAGWIADQLAYSLAWP
ncbi:MAG TPA: hypothetical protein VGC30_14740, partial [Dokdonella sp.]